MSDARARIHAMFSLPGQMESDLDERLNALIAEELRAVAADLGTRVHAGGPRARGLAFARQLLTARADGTELEPERRSVDHFSVAASLRTRPRTWGLVGDYRSSSSAQSVASTIRGGVGNIAAYRPSGSFEARVARLSDGSRVEARYVGGAS
ncbi:hypothetical protein [Streptomyces sp. B21-083]|uniref:hypothetical protein n=1 Tax=Streptomyces sp. B21-083 TaxID=3039410 RepID=UPI002FF127C5